MIYAQFYYNSTGYPTYREEDKKPIEACGSDSVAVLDARYNIPNLIAKAREIGAKRGKFTGFKLMRGERFTQSREITDYITL